MGLPEPTFRREANDYSEPPCGWCGIRTGGNWRFHDKSCVYVKHMCEQYAGIAAYVAGKDLPQWEGHKGPRKNAKH